jgi:2-dehydrotetronate isomerase
MPKFSANLGFLWPELALPDRVRAAGRAGFDAVECHVPYETPPGLVRAALAETGFTMLGINTRQGRNGPADYGVNALPGREDEARALLDEAIAYAAEIGAKNINATAGKSGGGEAAERTLRANYAYACEKAAPHGITILLEPINQRDAPGYHVTTVEQAVETVKAVGAPNLRIMFDFYHAQVMQGDVIRRLEAVLPWVGHIQFASAPMRQEPDAGELDYPWIFEQVDRLGWTGYLGAEYKPRTTTDAGLGWLDAWKKSTTHSTGAGE